MDEIEQLIEHRGDERITFADVADHLADFAAEHPDDAEVVARLARFLDKAERRHHHHEEIDGPGSDLPDRKAM